MRKITTDRALVAVGLSDSPALEKLLACLVQEEELAEFDLHWVALLHRLDPTASPALLLTAALARFAIDQGHVCLDLDQKTAWWPAPACMAGYPEPDTPALLEELRSSPLVGWWAAPQLGLPELDQTLSPSSSAHLPADQMSKSGPTMSKDPACLVSSASPQQLTPLVLVNNRLYLRRYWQYERNLAMDIGRRAVPVQSQPDLVWARWRLRELAAATGFELDGEQQRAVLAALCHHFTVISGGPGTGKTTIIFFILTILTHEAALFQAKSAREGESRGPRGKIPRILLLAPTGKAALRLGEAISQKQQSLATAYEQELPAEIPEPMTIHRALGYQADNPTIFRHDRDRPLPADLVVVDEASMVDLALMSKLLAAVPPQARLILLGDQDQLVSVEAGSVFGDICRASSSFASSWVISLRRAFRFASHQGVGNLVRGVKAGDLASVLALPKLGLNLGADDRQAAGFQPARAQQAKSNRGQLPISLEQWPEVTLNLAPEPENDPEFRALIVAGFRNYLEAPAAAEAYARINDFRLLCAHRRGPMGVERLNLFCRELLTLANLVPRRSPTLGADEWYKGRPLLVLANSYETRLFNGDLGLIWDSPEDGGELRAFFPHPDGLRRFGLASLPRHQTAFAMTIHKSQGSEFSRVAVVLPREDSLLLSRELLYTAVSRARRGIHLFAPAAIISQALQRRLQRSSGLAEQLISLARGREPFVEAADWV